MMPDLSVVQDEIDTEFSSYTATISARQEAYKADPLKGNGKYFQGLITHSVIPYQRQLNAVVKRYVPDLLADKPTDQEAGWTPEDFPPTMPASLMINTYKGDGGAGYVCQLNFDFDGDIYQRDINTGPESWRNTPWIKIDTELI